MKYGWCLYRFKMTRLQKIFGVLKFSDQHKTDMSSLALFTRSLIDSARCLLKIRNFDYIDNYIINLLQTIFCDS